MCVPTSLLGFFEQNLTSYRHFTEFLYTYMYILYTKLKFEVIYIFCALKSKNLIIILSLYFFTCDQGAVFSKSA